MYNIAENRCI